LNLTLPLFRVSDLFSFSASGPPSSVLLEQSRQWLVVSEEATVGAEHPDDLVTAEATSFLDFAATFQTTQY
jgi:hypothetical protein